MKALIASGFKKGIEAIVACFTVWAVFGVIIGAVWGIWKAVKSLFGLFHKKAAEAAGAMADAVDEGTAEDLGPMPAPVENETVTA